MFWILLISNFLQNSLAKTFFFFIHIALQKLGKLVSEYKNAWIAHARLCGMFDGNGNEFQRCSIPRRTVCNPEPITELAYYSGVCKPYRRQQIITRLRWKNQIIKSTTHRSANHHIQSCKFHTRLKSTKTRLCTKTHHNLNCILIFGIFAANRQGSAWFCLERLGIRRMPCHERAQTIRMPAFAEQRNQQCSYICHGVAIRCICHSIENVLSFKLWKYSKIFSKKRLNFSVYSDFCFSTLILSIYNLSAINKIWKMFTN